MLDPRPGNGADTPATALPPPSLDETRSLARFCGLDADIAADILSDHHTLSEDRGLTAYYNLIRSVMFSDRKFTDVDRRLGFELAPEKNAHFPSPGRFQLLCALSAYDHAVENFKNNGFPFSAFQEGAVDLAIHARQHRLDYDESGLSWNSLCWWGNLVRGTVIRQGRLEFNTSMSFFEDLAVWRDKRGAVVVRDGGSSMGDGWENVLRKGDPVVYLHFPGGGPLKPEDFIGSLGRIIDFLKKHLPSYGYRAIVSTSWLFDAQFQTILGPDSNLVKIQKLLRIHPSACAESDAVERVFGVKGVRNGIDTVPHDTSMRKAFAGFLHRGGRFRSGVMILLPEEAEILMAGFQNPCQASAV